MKTEDITLPENWPLLVRQAMLHAISLAHFAIICSWSRAANSTRCELNLKAKLEKLQTENSQLRNQNRIILSRFGRIPPQHRPHYLPHERMEILAHKTACGWNLKQSAEAFLIEAATISSWMKCVDDDSLVKIPVPWNKYPDFLKYAVRQLKILVPVFGKKKIAEYFVRSGLHLSAASVGRYLKTSLPSWKPEEPEPKVSVENKKEKIVRSYHPNHTWMMDLTTVPTCGGFWVSWLPNALTQSWPFCYWVSVIIDHFSRKVIGFAVFKKQPSSKNITDVLNKAVRRAKRKPKYIITDKGSQFTAERYKSWCEKKKIRPRYGAVGKYGSIAIIERFIKSLKNECTRQISIPLNPNEMRREISLYVEWYNQYRPHEHLKSMTPQEFYSNSPSLKTMDFKNASDISELKPHISYLEGRPHLPVVEIKKAA